MCDYGLHAYVIYVFMMDEYLSGLHAYVIYVNMMDWMLMWCECIWIYACLYCMHVNVP